MKLVSFCVAVATTISLASATIFQNDQVRITDYPNTVIDPDDYDFTTYPPSSAELSYKGRWDSKYISWWRKVNRFFYYSFVD